MNGYKLLSMKSIAQQLNTRKYTDYFYRLSLIAKSRFEWTGLDELGIDEKWIEKYLFSLGSCVFFKDKEKGLMVAKCTIDGNLNYYDEPISVRPYATGYQGESLVNGKECVIIRNNDDMIPTSPTIQLYAMDLATISRAIDVNINAQKTPILVRCTERQKNSVKQAYNQFTGNEPVIYADKEFDSDSFDVLETSAPIVFDKLQIQKHEVWDECLTYLGINNANTQKRERLITNEVDSNNIHIEMNAQVMLKSRELACKQINKLFGTNISVKLRTSNIEEYEELEDGDEDVR